MTHFQRGFETEKRLNIGIVAVMDDDTKEPDWSQSWEDAIDDVLDSVII